MGEICFVYWAFALDQLHLWRVQDLWELSLAIVWAIEGAHIDVVLVKEKCGRGLLELLSLLFVDFRIGHHEFAELRFHAIEKLDRLESRRLNPSVFDAHIVHAQRRRKVYSHFVLQGTRILLKISLQIAFVNYRRQLHIFADLLLPQLLLLLL